MADEAHYGLCVELRVKRLDVTHSFRFVSHADRQQRHVGVPALAVAPPKGHGLWSFRWPPRAEWTSAALGAMRMDLEVFNYNEAGVAWDDDCGIKAVQGWTLRGFDASGLAS